MNTIPVALFSDRAQAEPVLRRLAQAGFNATINECPHLTRLWFMSPRTADVRIEVPSDQFGGAEQLLLDWDASEGSLQGAIRCPECGSFRVEYPQFARHSLLTNLALGLLAELRFVEKDYYCEDCHYTWPKEGIRARHNRPHLAPFYFIEGVEQSGSGHRKKNSQEHVDEQQRKAA